MRVVWTVGQPVLATGHHGSEHCLFASSEILFLSGAAAGGSGGVIDLELTLCGLSGNKLDGEIEKFIRF